MTPITPQDSRDGRDFVEVEVLLAFFESEVAGDAAAGQRHQQVNVHGIDLDDSVGSGGKQALAVGRPGDAAHGAAVSSESDEFAPAFQVPDSHGLVVTC